MLANYNPIYEEDREEDYDTLRQRQPHFSEGKPKDQSDFYLRGQRYRRSIAPFHFDIDMFHGYDMYLPTLSVVKDSIIGIGEWIWNNNEDRWVFYKNRSAEKYYGVSWEDPELNKIIEEGTEILAQEKYIPDKYGWHR